MHIVSTMANHQFLELERVLDYDVQDVFAYLQYLDAKAVAENAQQKFRNEINKNRK